MATHLQPQHQIGAIFARMQTTLLGDLHLVHGAKNPAMSLNSLRVVMAVYGRADTATPQTSVAEIAQATGIAPTSISRIAQVQVKRGTLIRIGSGRGVKATFVSNPDYVNRAELWPLTLRTSNVVIEAATAMRTVLDLTDLVK